MGFFGVKKRHPYPSTQRSNGDKAIIEKKISPCSVLRVGLRIATGDQQMDRNAAFSKS